MMSWMQIVREMRDAGRAEATLGSAAMQHPRDAGMHHAVGVPSGQRATYALRLADGGALYVYDFGARYVAKLVVAARAPTTALEATLRQSPGSSVVGASAIGALLGLALGSSKESALVGASVSAVSVANAESSPATSDASLDVLNAALETMRARVEASRAAGGPATLTGGQDATPKRLVGTSGSALRKRAREPKATAPRARPSAKKRTP